MRKQDRIANQQQSRPQPKEPTEREQNREPQEREQIKGGTSETQPARPPRQPGKLPLPD